MKPVISVQSSAFRRAGGRQSVYFQRGGSDDKAASVARVTACPVELAIHIIGGKWKMLVLRSLLLDGPQRYNQLLKSAKGISPKELTRNLAELKASDLIAQPGSIELRTLPYSLTPLGEGLMPVFKSLLMWGRKLVPRR